MKGVTVTDTLKFSIAFRSAVDSLIRARMDLATRRTRAERIRIEHLAELARLRDHDRPSLEKSAETVTEWASAFMRDPERERLADGVWGKERGDEMSLLPVVPRFAITDGAGGRFGLEYALFLDVSSIEDGRWFVQHQWIGGVQTEYGSRLASRDAVFHALHPDTLRRACAAIASGKVWDLIAEFVNTERERITHG